MPKPPLPDAATADAQALAMVQKACGWHVAPEQEDTVLLDGPGSGVLLLPSLHVVSVTSIYENSDLVEPTDYEWSATGVVRRTYADQWRVDRQPRWTNRLRGISVTFVHGYAEMPLDLQQVVDSLSASMQSTERGLVSKTIGPFSESYGSDPTYLADGDRALLGLYRLPKVPT